MIENPRPAQVGDVYIWKSTRSTEPVRRNPRTHILAIVGFKNTEQFSVIDDFQSSMYVETLNVLVKVEDLILLVSLE